MPLHAGAIVVAYCAMSVRPLSLVVAGLLALAAQASAAEPRPLPESLPVAINRQLDDVVALKAKTDEAAAALRAWYNMALDLLRKNALGKGDLDAVLAADSERERIGRDLTEQEKNSLPLASLQVRTQYDQARANQATQEKVATAALLRAYLATLESLEKRLTQQGDIDAALATRKERTAAAQQLSSTLPLPGDVLAAEPPKPGPAASPRPVATPALLASRTTPTFGKGGAAPVFQVATEVKAKAPIENPGPESIGFNGPDGDGRRASRGVLLKNVPDTGNNGTTWAFKYTRSASAQIVQIVHPHGKGHVVVNLRTAEVTVSTPTNWGESTKGDPKKVKMLREAGSIFPLQDNQTYHVVSAISGTGGFTLTIDSKVVATGRAGNASAVALGAGFADPAPPRLAPGNSMLLVGPIDNGVNSCRDITFQASAAEPPR